MEPQIVPKPLRRAVLRVAWSSRVGVVLALLAAVVVVLAFGTPALGHPLGNFTVNTSARFLASPGTVTLRYTVDLAEIPTTQAIAEIDTDADGTPGDPELASWAQDKCPLMLSNMSVRLDGAPVTPTPEMEVAEADPGQAPGTRVIRLTCTAIIHTASTGEVAFEDRNFQGGAGWAEVTAAAEAGVVLDDADVPEVSPTDELRRYPDDAKEDPLDVTTGRFRFEPSGSSVSPAAHASSGASPGSSPSEPGASSGSEGGFIGLVGRPGSAAVALLLAVCFGMLHALAPGHGKTLTAAYLVGAGARPAQAAFAGIFVALMHAASVIALAAVIVWVRGLLPPEAAYPWLGMISGAVVAVLGVTLLRRRSKGHAHAHAHEPVSRTGMAALALGGGLVPSPTAVVVLLGAVALDRAGLGVALVVAFSVGLAIALVGIALVSMRVRDALERRSERTSQLVSLGGAWVTVIVGIVIFGRGLLDLLELR